MLPTLLSLRKKLRTEPWVCYRFEPEALQAIAEKPRHNHERNLVK
jgi:hypothetical protein